MLRESFRAGLASVRRAGWRAFLLAALSYPPIVGLGELPNPVFLLVGIVLNVLLLVALVRVLGAWRTEPLPAVPQVDEKGRRTLPPPRPGPPTTEADRSPFTALRNAWRLGRPVVSLTGLLLLAQFGAFVVVGVVSGGKLVEASEAVQVMTVLPVAALFFAFVALAPQRVGLEGDPRVLVAAAHSVRIAKTTYGPLLLLTVIDPAIAVGLGLATSGDDVPLARVLAVLGAAWLAATVAKVVVTAVSNELYLRGERLDLPLDPAR